MSSKKRVEGSLPKKHRPGGSCAECKRLKIKCAKGPHDTFPCESCLRRGCQSICPQGFLTAGKASNRFVLANTEQLHEKIIELSTRVHQLEDALEELQAMISSDPHPLLRRDLLLVKAPLESETVLAEGEHSSDHESLDAFGSLSINGQGRTNFHGQGAGAWFLLQNEDSDLDGYPDDGSASPLPIDILYASHTFPLGTLEDTQHDLRLRILEFVPSRDISLGLVENYFNGMSWWYDPIPRKEFDNKVLDAIYPTQFSHIRTGDMHALALLFIVLAIGTLLDLEIPNYSPQATQYYQLSRAALALDLSLDDPSLAAVQALHLMGFFLHMSDMKSGFGTSWALMGLNSKLAIGIGLHRDSAKWKLGGDEEIRRQVFWELYTYDTWQALPCGRPQSFNRLSIDAKMPFTHVLSPDVASSSPEAVDVFKAWKHRFCYERLSPMIDQSFGPRTPSYATILLLDRKIREDPIPPILQIPPPSGTDGTTRLVMQRYAVLCVREIALLLMHRPFFAQAVSEKVPLEAKFAPSVLAVYRSSCSIIAGVRAVYDKQPRLTPRVWFFWAHIFSATICLGGLVARCPKLSLASSALAQVDSACELFSKVTDSNRVSKSLPSMLKLREKAHHAFRNGGGSVTADEELSALVGETRLVSHQQHGRQLLSPAQTDATSTAATTVSSVGTVDSAFGQQHSPGYYNGQLHAQSTQGYPASSSSSGLVAAAYEQDAFHMQHASYLAQDPQVHYPHHHPPRQGQGQVQGVVGGGGYHPGEPPGLPQGYGGVGLQYVGGEEFYAMPPYAEGGLQAQYAQPGAWQSFVSGLGMESFS